MRTVIVAPKPGRWLPDLIAALGPPETTEADRERWTWFDGDSGVFIDKFTHAWQVTAWTSHRSVSMRSENRPTDVEIGRMVMLAGLYHEPGRHAGLGIACTPCAGPCRIDGTP